MTLKSSNTNTEAFSFTQTESVAHARMRSGLNLLWSMAAGSFEKESVKESPGYSEVWQRCEYPQTGRVTITVKCKMESVCQLQAVSL